MLFVVAAILIVLWALGLLGGVAIGGALHILIVIAVILIVFSLFSSRSGPSL